MRGGKPCLHFAVKTLASVGIATASSVAMPVRGQDDTITKSEVRTDPPNRTHRRLRDVVWDAFEVQDYRRDAAPTRPLRTLYLRTKTHATHIRNLCRYDSVWVEFEKLDPHDSGPDAPVKAVGLTSTSNWTFLAPPPAEDWWEDEPVSAQECAALPEDAASFSADDELEAVEGYLAWMSLRNDIASGRELPLECELFPREEANCSDVIRSIPVEQLSWVGRCSGDDGGRCYELALGNRRIFLNFNEPLSGSNPRIAKAKLESLIVISDELVD